MGEDWAARLLAAEQGRAYRAESRALAAEAMLEEMTRARERQRVRLMESRQELADRIRDIDLLRKSTSWRVTRPLRATMTAFDQLRGRVPDPVPPLVPLLDRPAAGGVSSPLRATSGGPVRAVHQVLARAESSDRGVRAAYETQAWLRDAGYESKIFAEYRDRQYLTTTFPIEDIPLHDRYVILVRLSQRFIDAGRFLGLPAAKLFLIHGQPPWLDEMRPLGRVAMADSIPGVIALRRQGCDEPRLGVDGAALAYALGVVGAMPPIEQDWRKELSRSFRLIIDDIPEQGAPDDPVVVVGSHPGVSPRDLTIGSLEQAPNSASSVDKVTRNFDAIVVRSPEMKKAVLDAGVARPVRALAPAIEDDWRRQVVVFAADLIVGSPLPPPRIGFVSTWDVACGIAEYSRYLLETFPPGDVAVFCDDRTPFGASDERVRVRPAWSLGASISVEGLARAIATEDSEVIVIQHHPALLGWKCLTDLLTDRRLAERTVVVTLHAAARLLDIEDETERGAVIAALAGVERVLVHRDADVELLAEAGLAANVALFPQGAPLARLSPEPRALSRLDDATIGCFGFFLPGKGIAKLIEAVARLRIERPALRLRLVNAVYPSEASTAELADCRALAETLGLKDAIDWHTSFLPDAESQRLLSGCDLMVLPYEPSKESSSAALRGVMSSMVPVAVTSIALFEEAGDAVHRFDSGDPEAIARGIDNLLRDQPARQALRKAAGLWLAERSWQVLGARLHGMLMGLHGSRVFQARPDPEIIL